MIDFDKIAQLQDLCNDLPAFDHQLETMAQTLNISLSEYLIDHISVRCHHLATAMRWHEGLLKCARLISDNQINGRPIRLYQLKKPIQIAKQDIFIIELPFPKDKIYPQESWEHIEIVIEVSPDELESAARKLLPEPLPEGYSIKVSQPRGQKERLPNPTLAVTNGLISVKYHPFSLKNIIKSEKK